MVEKNDLPTEDEGRGGGEERPLLTPRASTVLSIYSLSTSHLTIVSRRLDYQIRPFYREKK
jgi:hypothetical protein